MGTNEKDGQQATKRQHFIPQFYLRNFARKAERGKRDQIYVRDLETRRAWRTATENAALETGFYDMTDEHGNKVSLEPHLGRLETEMAPAVERLININPKSTLTIGPVTTAFGGLTFEERRAIALFCATISTRGPAPRRRLRQHYDKIHEQARMLQAQHPRVPDKQVERFAISDAAIAQGVNLSILEMAPGLANIYMHRGWVLAKAEPAHPLITSDNPLVSWSLDGSGAPWADGYEAWLPLNPTTALGFYRRDDGGPPLPVQHMIQLEAKQVEFLNWLQRTQAVRFLYSMDDTPGEHEPEADQRL